MTISRSLLCVSVLVATATACDYFGAGDGDLVVLVPRSGTPSAPENGVLVDIQVHATETRQLHVITSAGSVALEGLTGPAAEQCLRGVRAGGHVYPARFVFEGDEVVIAATLVEDRAGQPCSGAAVDAAAIAIPRAVRPAAATADAGADAPSDQDGGLDATLR